MPIVLYREDPWANLVKSFSEGVNRGMLEEMAFQDWKRKQDYIQSLKEQEKSRLMELLSSLSFDVPTEDVYVERSEFPQLKAPQLNIALTPYSKIQEDSESLFMGETFQPSRFIFKPKEDTEIFSDLLNMNKQALAGALAYGVNLFPYIREYANTLSENIKQRKSEEKLAQFVNSAIAKNPYADEDTKSVYLHMLSIDPKQGVKFIQEDLKNANLAEALAPKLKEEPQTIYRALGAGLKAEDIVKLYNKGYSIKEIGGLIVAVDNLGNVITNEDGTPKVLGYTPKYLLEKWKAEQHVRLKEQELNLDRHRLSVNAADAADKKTQEQLRRIKEAIDLIYKKYKFNPNLSTEEVIDVLQKVNPQDAVRLKQLYNRYETLLENAYGIPRSEQETKQTIVQPPTQQKQPKKEESLWNKILGLFGRKKPEQAGDNPYLKYLQEE